MRLQLIGMTRSSALAVAVFSLALVCALGHARADEASGTWTGQVDVRTNYYWETSTRVIAPEVGVRLESPDGVNITANYLLDAITSASIAAGVQEDIRFTEVRNQGSVGINREFDLGEAQLRLGSTARVSFEPDYVATGVRLYSDLALNRRATTFSLSLGYIHDDVGSVLRGGMPRVDDMGRDLSDRGRQGQLEGIQTGLVLNQVLTPVTTLVAGYQLVHNWGYLQNPYRRASVAGATDNETHPGQRSRHAAVLRLAHFFPETQTAIHAMARAYVDDWDLAAVTPEVRVYQMIGPSVMVRLRYRYHIQTGSYFFQQEYDGSEPFFSADPKMSEFDSHLVGVQLRVGLDFLGRTPLSFLERSWLDLSFNYWFQTSSFGDAVLAQAGIRAPF